jgi:hypothetical protein
MSAHRRANGEEYSNEQKESRGNDDGIKNTTTVVILMPSKLPI